MIEARADQQGSPDPRSPGIGLTRRSGPVSFDDVDSLQRSLERRHGDRRCRQDELPEPVRMVAHDELGTRELCHDLRQPLASAAVLAHVLQKEPGLTDTGRERLELLQRELGRLGGMLTAHLEPAAPALVDLVALVRDVHAGTGRAAGGQVELLLEAVPLIAAQPFLLMRMIANLISNAQCAAGESGRVRVAVERLPEGAAVRVEDSGGAADQSRPSGYGLGLMIVEAVAARHGGRLSCSASELGGLRISVVLPAAVSPQGARASS